MIEIEKSMKFDIFFRMGTFLLISCIFGTIANTLGIAIPIGMFIGMIVIGMFIGMIVLVEGVYL